MNVPARPPAPTELFSNLSREHGFEPVRVEGTLPVHLRGTLYRNGPGILEQFGRRYDHLFEGDGAITAIRFADGGALAAARVIESAGLREERAAGRHLSSFAAPWPTRVRRMLSGRLKNTANTHVVEWRGALYALSEGGRPTQLDPDSLRTIGESDLGGVVATTFSAHPHRVARRRTLYNFGMSYGKQTALTLFALPDDGPARFLGRIPLSRPVLLHDYIATDKHLVFFVSPVRVVVWRMMMALRSFTDNFMWTPTDGTEVIVVPIDTPDRPIRFCTDPFCQFHFAGAFEDRGEIVVDYVRYPDSRLLGALGDGTGLSWTDPSTHVHGELHRARIDLAKKQLRSAPLWEGHCEYPRIAEQVAGGRHQHIWLQSSRYVDGVMRFQISRIDEDGASRHHTFAPGELCSEPVLAQSQTGREDDGSVLTLVYDSHTARSHVAVLDARTLSPQVRVQLTQAIPLTFHGSWWPMVAPPS